uniref:Uncharacterized protein n=1 Tax=Emiliania huxleyi (strain CCMP1516) TaxID=280463 RepID=A0A0D3JR38_EMIH1
MSAAIRASRPAAAARPVEAGLGPARDGWPPTSALALLVKMAAVAIAATVVQSYSAQAPLVCRLLSHFAHARAARPASLREGMSLPRFDPAAKSCSLEPADSTIAAAAVELSRRLEVLTRFLLEFFYPHDSERECDRTIGSFGHQTEITREQLSLPLASPPSPPGIRGILWVVQSIDLWLVSQPHFEGAMNFEGAMKYSDRHLADLSARPPDRVELIGAGSLGYGTGPSFG